ncbi:MAG: tetratricopeptide repeat protein [Acidobacteriota bacterium]|nr:tetratricopeptide repeat protein [Acidobacteriota bacterium]
MMLYQYEHIARDETLSLISGIIQRVAPLDENAPETLAMLGYVKLILEWDWENAELCYQKSLAANPNYVIARSRYSNLLMLSGRFSESLAHLRAVLAFDPLSIPANVTLGRVFYVTEQFDNAIIQLEETLELERKNYPALLLLGAALAARGRYDAALKAFYDIRDWQNNIETLSMIGYTFALGGQENEAQRVIKQIESQAAEKDLDATNLAYIHVALGETKKAFEYFEKSFIQRSTNLIGVKVDPRLKPINRDAKFKNLVCRIGLSTD